MSDKKLRECPFCGNKVKYEGNLELSSSIEIRCMNLDCFLNIVWIGSVNAATHGYSHIFGGQGHKIAKAWNTRPSAQWVPEYDVNVKDIHQAIDRLMEHIEKADENTAILICEINNELHGDKLIQIQLRAELNPELFIPGEPKEPLDE